MKDFKNKFNNVKDKTTGKIAEAAGKVTGNETLELKGKLLRKKVDFKKKMDIKDSVKDVKEGVIGKINDMIDEKDKKDKQK